MISEAQMERAEQEFSHAAHVAIDPARSVELALERHQNGPHPRGRDPMATDSLVSAYREADYVAESRAWIASLIRTARKPKPVSGLPTCAVCYFMDGDQWCCAHADFVNVQESPCGFGPTMADALSALIAEDKKQVDAAVAARAAALAALVVAP